MKNTMAENIAKEITDTFKSLAKTETVIGKEFKVGNILVIPVIKVSLGFGVGGGGGEEVKTEDKAGAGGGGGGGMAVEPIAFLVVSGNEVHLMNVGRKSNIEAIFDSMPELVSKTANVIKDIAISKKDEKEEKK